jgi:DNA ligase (NAD+)
MPSKMELSELVALLERASDAYYNGGDAILGDEAFDSLKEELMERAPNHPFLTKVGAPVKENSVRLPVFMPSLNKVKPGNRAFASFLQKSNLVSKGYVLSDKLDGISALWIPKQKKLLLRGDGAVGQDVSNFVSLGITGLIPSTEAIMVRGELVMKKADVPENTIGRSWVNGQLHQKTPSRETVSKIRFVAYELFSETPMIRGKQFAWLAEKGYEIPWYKISLQVDEAMLKKTLQERRETGVYEIDGIVLGMNKAPEKEDALRNPSDMVAFKMVMEDQCADTKIVAIHWNVSNQKFLIPRIEIEPVRIGGAMIQFLTGHNARFLLDKKLAVGAGIRVRRSGDVIPCVDGLISESKNSVLSGFPATGTWEWVGEESTAAHIQMKEASSDELLESRLEHFVRTLGIDGMGPGQVKKLVEANVKTPKQLCQTKEADLQTILGKKSGSSCFTQIQEKLLTLDEMTLMIASSCMPRGIGEKKLQPLFTLQPNPQTWTQFFATPRDIDGWSIDALQTFAKSYSVYETWRKTEFTLLPYPIQQKVSVVVQPTKGTFCCTGFRDSALEKLAEEKGWASSVALTKKVSVLLIPDKGDASGTKVEKARESGIPILRKEEFIKKYLT